MNILWFTTIGKMEGASWVMNVTNEENTINRICKPCVI